MMEEQQFYRIGIDVGGTFTHAVAINVATLELAAKAKVKTTHNAAEGVARGIIDSLHAVLETGRIAPESVTFIAHSTTQATNALLEGDVATVGIIGMGSGPNAWLAAIATRVPPIELSKGKFLQTHHQFIDTAAGVNEKAVREAVDRLVKKGAAAIAVSEAFGVDKPDCEEAALAVVRSMGLPATSGAEVSKLYGLRVRTRTAVINAAMLPKMIETANMTEQSVRAAGIKAPIMIMRSDGGVMDIDAMRKRPILTRLSGPAAGVAAAMMYLQISDGIFLEVGGTSTDISVIRNGKALVKDTEIGGHRVFLRSLDVITLGVAGGSMIRIEGNTVKDVGPRSAHIAGLDYVAFAEPVASPQVELLQPKPGDPSDYVSITGGDKPLALTTTCAANFRNLVPSDAAAAGMPESCAAGFRALAAKLATTAEAAADQVLEKAYQKCLPVIRKFMLDYKLDLETVMLIGGGGGAAAIVPYAAKQLGAEHAIAREADVISAIGVALALVRETVERQIPQPKQEDLIRIREEALAAVTRMGADASSVEVHVEVDARSNIVRATAFGAAGLTSAGAGAPALSEEDKLTAVSSSLKAGKDEVKLLAGTEHFKVWGHEHTEKRLFGLLRHRITSLRVMDQKGVIRLKTRNAVVRSTKNADVEKTIADVSEEQAVYGDAGKQIPDFMLLAGHRLIDLSGLLDTWQVQTLARTELSSMLPDAPVVVVASLP